MLSDFFKKSCIPAARVCATKSIIERTAPSRGGVATLTIAALEQLAPHGHLKANYPDVWKRISLFCGEPAHLEKYLMSLSIQDRGNSRAGLRPEALGEITNIQAANQRFLMPSTASTPWDVNFLQR
jgi:hypothetical protein